MVRFQQGQSVFTEGDHGRTMFIVQSGLVGLYQEVNGERQHLGTLEKGDFFGEMSILEGMPRTCSAVAENEAEVIEINHTVFDKMIRGNIEIAVRMLRKLSIRLREAESRVASLQAGGGQPSRPLAQLKERIAMPKGTDCKGARLEAEEEEIAFALGEQGTLVGRFDPVTMLRPDIDLTDLDLKRTVSRQHARILQGGEGYSLVEEVGALNGTFVNEERLTAGQPRLLQDGDRLAFGSVCVTFRT
jgi:CRP-like cAMP-binding protein